MKACNPGVISTIGSIGSPPQPTATTAAVPNTRARRLAFMLPSPQCLSDSVLTFVSLNSILTPFGQALHPTAEFLGRIEPNYLRVGPTLLVGR